ncbi:unnamed protein product [Urochloa decumbens]|uniref:Protein kinase domain-containing protein n=1 Tax=Urochloa decumbens TaxID=240449 RepID=A0ABC9B3P1_9POAL
MKVQNCLHRWSSTLLLLVVAVVLVLPPQQLSSPFLAAAAPFGRPGRHCPTKCGDMSVPYPFGTTAGCSFPGFDLTCDSEHSPPRLLLGDGATGVEVTDIFLGNASMRVLTGAIVNHTSPSDPGAKGTWGLTGGGDDDRGSGPFVLSYHNNKFVTVGCNVQATLLWNGTQVVNGCSSFCSVDSQRHWQSGPSGAGCCSACSGNGCCKVTIPMYFPTYGVELNKVDQTHNPDPQQHGIVFIAEKGWIDGVWCQMIAPTGGQPPDLLSKVPVLLEWAMDSMTPAQPGIAADNSSRCPLNGIDSVCKSNYSYCIDKNSPFRSGYACQCLRGYDGNPYIDGGCQDVDECTDPDNYPCYGECTNTPGAYRCQCPRGFHGNSSVMHGCVKSSSGLSIAVGVVSGATLLVIASSTAFLIREVKTRRNKRIRQLFFKQNRGHLLQQLVHQRADIAERMIITLEELEKATNNFDKSRELGGGGHGTVYKGILSSQQVVAIKKSKIVIQREINEFINEVAILSQVNHRNIVKLIGCCLETEVPLLVYEFISNGTLHNCLHVEAPWSLPWRDRLRIAVEIARSLAYLHSFVSTPIIHRDIKSPNILLDDNLTVKLSDFGASRYILIDQEGMHTDVQGTLGYLDPMYQSTGRLTEKSDVYSFGVLLIELLTRKKPVSYRSSQGFGLVNHFVSLMNSQGNLNEILDPQVSREGDGEVVDITLLAQMCVKFSSEDRPTMREVEMILENIQAAKLYFSDITDDDRSSEGTNNLGSRSWD